MSKISAEVLFSKISGFCYTQNIHLFWHEGTEETGPYISLNIPESFSIIIFRGSSKWLQQKYLACKNMFKVDDSKKLELLQLMLYKQLCKVF